MIAKRQARATARAAFTLMEMLVVVAILVVLAGAAVPIYLNYLANARIDRAKTDVVQLQTAVEAYASTHNGMYPQSLEILCEVDQMTGQKAALEYKALQDPWGNHYMYEPQNLNPRTGRPRIHTTVPNTGQVISNW